MDHRSEKNIFLPNRLGFHYFPDAQHYSEMQIKLWMPILDAMKVGWLVVHSPLSRAIPEDFIRSMADGKINIVIDFNHPLNADVDWDGLETLIRAYGQWGVKYALLDRRANMRAVWGSGRWGNPALVSNYADQFTRFSEMALENAIHPVFGPLVPGGDYWDLAFLQTALTRIAESAPDIVRNNLTLSAYAWDFGRPLDWGAGGPGAWPNAGPYKKPDEFNQNQQGFRTHEWYDAAARTVFGKSLPIMLFEAGISLHPELAGVSYSEPDLGNQLAIFGLLKGANVYDRQEVDRLLSPISLQVIACNYFVLSSANKDDLLYQWFLEDGQRLPPAQAIYVREGILDALPSQPTVSSIRPESPELSFRYGRYVLIAETLQPSADQILASLHYYIEKHKPMVGFSAEDAAQAAIIIAITPDGRLNTATMEKLKQNGGLVKVIRPDKIPDLTTENVNEKA